MRWAGVLLLSLLLSATATARQLSSATIAAFDEYVRLTEQRMAGETRPESFLWIDSLPKEEREADDRRLRNGEIVTQHLQTLKQAQNIDVPGGLIHHWIGTVFIPGASMAGTVAFLQDYDNQYKFYAPDVERSHLISRSGDDFRLYLRLHRKKVVTVVLNTEYAVHYSWLGKDRAMARSYSTRIAQVEHPGEAGESEKPVGDDDGFLWRLNSYWRIFEQGGGTYVQLEAISLTRDIPSGLGWLIRPFITSVPEESLKFTLSRTRSGLCCAK